MLRLFLESLHKHIAYYGSGFLSWGNPELEVSHLILLPRTRSSFPQEKQLEGYLGNEGRESVSRSYETTQGDCQGQGKMVQGEKEQEFRTKLLMWKTRGELLLTGRSELSTSWILSYWKSFSFPLRNILGFRTPQSFKRGGNCQGLAACPQFYP